MSQTWWRAAVRIIPLHRKNNESGGHPPNPPLRPAAGKVCLPFLLKLKENIAQNHAHMYVWLKNNDTIMMLIDTIYIYIQK